jgi:predicted transcriptional regulator
MPPELSVKLDQFAAAYGVSRSEMLRHALQVFIEREPLPSE